MAEAWLRHYLGKKAEIFSAGIESRSVHPLAIQVMKEVGIDIHMHTSNEVSDYLHLQFDTVITVNEHARDNMPWFPKECNRVHAAFNDPTDFEDSDEGRLRAFRKVRDQIKEWSQRFAQKYLAAQS